MRKLLIITLAFCLTACATFTNPVNTTRLAQIESAYGIALSGAVAYRNLRLCRRGEVATATNICAYRHVIIKLQQADMIAQSALRDARIFVQDNPTVSAFDVLRVAQNAVSTFQQIMITYGVN